MSARQILAQDVMSREDYALVRAVKRSEISKLKKLRRIAVGPFATFHFENYDTMWHQIHEMLYIENGGPEQVLDELSAYNPLIPKGAELVATLMFEIDDPVRRDRELRSLTGVEGMVELRLGRNVVTAIPENDVNRTKADGKTSSIHFVRFPFEKELLASFSDTSQELVLAVTHANYQHRAVIANGSRDALASDL